ncbi:MAG TPA: glycosyltransferase [Chloroflexota bacterium]|nr:glycosyltransferase [Chloroflexota bacterium]
MLVHNRLEQDPRVSRQARTIVEMGYRAAVLCAAVPPGPGGYRWGAWVAGATVYESGPQATILGHARALLTRLARVRPGLAARDTHWWVPGSHRRAGARDDVPAHQGTHVHRPDRLPQVPTRASRVPACGCLALPGTGWSHASGIVGTTIQDFWDFGRLLYWNLTIFRQFRSIGAAVIHANDLNVLPAGFLLARAWRAQLLYDSHELWVEQDTEWTPFYRRLQGWLERFLIRRADAVLTVNGAIADELAARYGIARPSVVMNCPEAPDLQEPPRIEPNLLLRTIYQGVLVPNRGLSEVVDAVAATPETGLVLRGPGNLKSDLEAQIGELGVGDRVCVADPVPMAGMVPALHGFAIGFVPILPKGMSYTLCSPNKLFEYMSAGLAVICSDLPVLREIVLETGCGLLVPPGDHEAIAAALQRLAADPDLLLTMRTRALTAARDRYNAEIEQRRLRAVYARLLARGRRSARRRTGLPGKEGS